MKIKWMLKAVIYHYNRFFRILFINFISKITMELIGKFWMSNAKLWRKKGNITYFSSWFPCNTYNTQLQNLKLLQIEALKMFSTFFPIFLIWSPTVQYIHPIIYSMLQWSNKISILFIELLGIFVFYLICIKV